MSIVFLAFVIFIFLLKSGQSRTSVSYSPPSPAMLIWLSCLSCWIVFFVMVLPSHSFVNPSAAMLDMIIS